MASKGIQRINATADLDKEKVAERYKELKKIISINSNMAFKQVIEAIAHISVGTYYNYIYSGKQQGQVSQYTIDNLSEYFNLPKEVFTSEYEFTDDIKKHIADKIKEEFGEEKQLKTKPENTTSEVLNNIKEITIKLNDENNLDVLKNAIESLNLAIEIVNNRIDNINKINKMQR